MIDTHCHLSSEQFAGREDHVVRQALEAGVDQLITVATTSADAERCLALAERFDGVFCSAGVHPLYADEPLETSRDFGALERIGTHPKCVAWGELGLDNHYPKPARSTQDALLEQQLGFLQAQLENGVSKPIIVHCRDAFDELIAAFRATSLPPPRFVFHCFTGSPAEARQVLDFGGWISFTGVVTYRNAPEVAEAAAMVPVDRIMVETDAPYLTPEPVRKIRPNEPQYVGHTARFIAALKGLNAGAFEAQLDQNARDFFGLPPVG